MTTTEEELIKIIERTNELLKEALTKWAETVEKNKCLEKEIEELKKENKDFKDDAKQKAHLLWVDRKDIESILEKNKIDYTDDDVEDVFDWIDSMEFDDELYDAHMACIDYQVVEYVRKMREQSEDD